MSETANLVVALEALLLSVRAFNERFELNGKQTAIEVARNVHEEAGEVVLAIAQDNAEETRLETADFFYVLLQGVLARGGSATEAKLAKAFMAVANKNNAKTHVTHEVVDGKVRRRK
jgi:NTP pyrophosphatase (non-canonical NTP hydrolase)